MPHFSLLKAAHPERFPHNAKFHADQFRNSHNIKGITFNNLRDCSVGITDGGDLWMKYAVEMAAGGVIHIPSLMTIG
jgi:hypothetical protein